MSSSFIDAADAASKPDQSLLFPVYGILGVAEHPIAYMKGLGSSILRSISDSTPREDPQKAHKELIWKKRGTLDGGFWAKESYPPLPGKAEWLIMAAILLQDENMSNQHNDMPWAGTSRAEQRSMVP